MFPYNLRTQATEQERSLAGARQISEISGVFGAVCLTVGAVGLYGALAQAVARRPRGIGLRMALGARRSAVFGLVADAIRLVGFAVVPGLSGHSLRVGVEKNALQSAVTGLPTAAAAGMMRGAVGQPQKTSLTPSDHISNH